jgi:hypothetical protein
VIGALVLLLVVVFAPNFALAIAAGVVLYAVLRWVADEMLRPSPSEPPPVVHYTDARQFIIDARQLVLHDHRGRR